jgi:metal-sulfur cluster biosynthetic enzyme
MHAAVAPPPPEVGVRVALRDLIDPELGFNIVDLGLVPCVLDSDGFP